VAASTKEASILGSCSMGHTPVLVVVSFNCSNLRSLHNVHSSYNTPMPATDIITRLGGRSLCELIDPAFLGEHGLSRPAQYGMVCGDVAGEIRQLEALGATPFLHATMDAPGWTEQGRKKKVKVEMAMGYTGQEQIELLGPGVNTDFYRDAIPGDGALTLHHVCCMQNNLAQLKRQLPRAGYPLYLEGGINIGLISTHFAYFDTREVLGLWLEVAQYRVLGRHRPPTEAFITGLARLQRRLA